MIKTSLKTAFILLYFSVVSSAQTVQWYKTIKSQGNEEAYDIAVDEEGNAYVAGMIEYESDFGDNVILESVGSHDIFIAKYDSSGNLIWAKRAGGRGGDKVQSIVLDGQGFLYITGEFEDTCRWDTIAKMTPGIGVNNMFVARYDTAGHVQWVRNIQTNSHLHTRGYGVTSDAQSNVYVSGAIQGDAFYDSTYLFSTAGNYDCMLVKFDKYGNFRWAKRMGGTDSDKSRSIISDGGTNLYVTGYFSGTADFQGTTLTGRGHTDLFLAKFDTAGTLQWVTQAGDTGFDRGWDVDININGNILVVGDQSRGLFDTHMASCQGSTDAFVATYDTAGNNLWVAAGGGPEADECKGVAHDSSGNVYIIGDYGGTAIFPPVTFTGGTFAEVFIASYTMNGTSLRWARNGKGPLNERGYGIGLDPSGNIYTCGNFNDSLHIGNTVIYGDSLLDCFVTRFSPQNICSSIATITGTIDCFGSCNGTAMATASGQSPFSYNWSTIPVQHQQTATGLCAGSYTVSVTDSFGCISTASITLSDPLQIIVATTSTNITCYGACDGTGNAIANGQSALTYSWNTIPVQAIQNITGLCAGNYTVIVTDSLGCNSSSTITLTDPLQLLVSTSSTGITCNGVCDGTGNAIVNGQAPFAYSWNTVPVQTGQTATGLCAGNYIVNVTDSAGCIASASFPLIEPSAIILNANAVNTTCTGCADGSINLSPTGGTGVFQFSWSNGSTSEDLQNLIAGTYSVCVTDINQCMLCDTFVLIDPTTGIAGNDALPNFSVYPNPATDHLTIKIDDTFTAGANLNFYNSIGKLVFNELLSGAVYIMSVDNMPGGLYFLSIENVHTGEKRMEAILIR